MAPPSSPKILALAELRHVRDGLRTAGRTVVQCHGCFDIVHPGHIRYLRFAKSLGDVLMVSVSADDVVDKGFDRPYIAQDLRLENLAALEFVDYVCLSSHAWGGPVLETLRPDVYVKGREYETRTDARFAKEQQIVERYGGRVVFGSGDVVFSSSEIIRRRGGDFGLEAARVAAFCQRRQITQASLDALLRAGREKRVVVLGDAILDQYIFCEEAQVAAEGPIISVSPIGEDWFVGGGGLIARQLAALGVETTFLTACENGPQLARMETSLDRAGVQLETIETPSRPVFVKSRYLVDGQKVLKVNHGHRTPLPANIIQALIARLEALLPEADGLVTTDFGFDLFGEHLCHALPELTQRFLKPYYADVSSSGQANILKFCAPRVATPTERELRFALGDQESGLSTLAARYYRATHAHGLIITLGHRGAILFDPPQSDETRLKTDYLPAIETPARDLVGAGDLFLSGVVLCDIAGGSMAHGMYLGSLLAATGISRIGNDPASLLDLEGRVCAGADQD